jgi:peptidoglycan/LPS O-acetylase OafA/YrhL
MFGCGILIREVTRWRFKSGVFGDCAALAAFAGAVAWFGATRGPNVVGYNGPPVANSIFSVAFLFSSTWVMGYFALAGDGPLSKWFSWRWLRWFGNISYSYYLTHALVLQGIKLFVDFIRVPPQLSPPGYVALGLVCFALTVAGSAIVFLLIEKPLSFPGAKRVPQVELPATTGEFQDTLCAAELTP